MIIYLFLLIHQQLAQNLYTNSYNTTSGILSLKMTQYYANITTENKIRITIISLTQELPLLCVCNTTIDNIQQFKTSDELENFLDQNCIVDQLAFNLKYRPQQIIVQYNQAPAFISKNQNIFSIDKNQCYVIIYSQYDSFINLSYDLLDQAQCITDCKNQGRCLNGYCECQLGYFGIDCGLESKNIQTASYFSAFQFYYLDLIQLQTQDFKIQFSAQLNFSIICYANQIKLSLPYQENSTLYISTSDINQCKEVTLQLQKYTKINFQSQFIIITNTSIVIQLQNTNNNETDQQTLVIILASLLCFILVLIVIAIILKKKKQNQTKNKLQYGDLMPAQQFISVTDRRNQQADDQQCSICLEIFKPESLIRLTYCEHIFHSKCLQEWMTKNKVCPLCRAALDTQTISSKKKIEPLAKPKNHILQQLNLFQRHDGSLTSIDGSLTFHSPVIQQPVAHKPSRFMLK